MRELVFRRPFFRIEDNGFEGFGYWGIFDDEFRSPPSWSHCTHGEDQQLIGLTDREGREIYEGDIVKYIDNNGRDDTTAITSIIELYFNDWMEIVLKQCKVIGNVHQNPDLLEPK